VKGWLLSHVTRDRVLARRVHLARRVGRVCPHNITPTTNCHKTLRTRPVLTLLQLTLSTPDYGRQQLTMPSMAETRASPPWHHLLSRLLQARTHVTFHTATDVCLPFGMQFAAPHMLCTPNASQRLLTRLKACWNGGCVRRAGSDLNPNLLLVFTAATAVESFAVMSPTFRSA
jgi:hypothetical protein